MLETLRFLEGSSFLKAGQQNWRALTEGVVASKRVEEDVEGCHLETGLLLLLLLGLGYQAL